MNNPPIDYSRKWYTMVAVGSGLFLSTIDSSIVNIALPTMVKEFEVPFSTIQWVTLSYLLTITTLMLAIGRLADIKGKKPIYTLGFFIFVLGSFLCGLSPTVYWLIAFRVLQAVGAVMIMALGMGIVTEAFPPRERGLALGITGAIVSIGIILGPTLGGFIIDALDWQWIFFVNVPVGIIGVCMVFLYVPAIQPAGGQKFDYWGAAVLLLSLLSLLFALTLGQQLGFSDTRIRILFVAWILLSVLFIRIEQTSSQPMIDLKLFSEPVFTTGLITGFLTFTCMAGTIFNAVLPGKCPALPDTPNRVIAGCCPSGHGHHGANLRFALRPLRQFFYHGNWFGFFGRWLYFSDYPQPIHNLPRLHPPLSAYWYWHRDLSIAK